MPLIRQPQRLLAALAISTLGSALPAIAQTEIPPQFSAYDAESRLVVDTQPYVEIISALSVPENGRTLIAYDIAHAQGLPFLSEYADYLGAIPVEDLNRDEQLAFWLNTRNFLLVQALAEERRVRGFKKKRGTPEAPGSFWTETRLTVGDTSLSLQDIEQNILFAGWDDPNIIYGLYQGIKGGPALPRKPFTGANVSAELAEAGRIFNAESRNFRVRNQTVRVSTYFDWYLPLAFDGNEQALRQHLAGFAKQDQQQLVSADGILTRRNLSTDFEQYRARQVQTSIPSNSGYTPSGGFGS